MGPSKASLSRTVRQAECRFAPGHTCRGGPRPERTLSGHSDPRKASSMTVTTNEQPVQAGMWSVAGYVLTYVAVPSAGSRPCTPCCCCCCCASLLRGARFSVGLACRSSFGAFIVLSDLLVHLGKGVHSSSCFVNPSRLLQDARVSCVVGLPYPWRLSASSFLLSPILLFKHILTQSRLLFQHRTTLSLPRRLTVQEPLAAQWASTHVAAPQMKGDDGTTRRQHHPRPALTSIR